MLYISMYRYLSAIFVDIMSYHKLSQIAMDCKCVTYLTSTMFTDP
jgi:hypothetical protein